MKINTLTIKGYKSIEDLDNFDFHNINVLIGANGAGKSNLISLFRLLASLPQNKLQDFVQKRGGPDALLFGGRKNTKEIKIQLSFGSNQYEATMEPTDDNRLIIASEAVSFQGPGYDKPFREFLGGAYEETRLTRSSRINQYVLDAFKSWVVYHFHDTSDSAEVKQQHPSNDNLRLQPDARNLAAYLALLKTTESHSAYERIVRTIRLTAPFFDDFVIRNPLPSKVELEWIERDDEFQTPQRANVFSDGTLRFICLTALLQQPVHMLPDTILIDEPELGLHPYAITLLAEMLKQVADTKQVIISTQSVELLNHFAPEDVIVVDREAGASTFRRLEQDDLVDWLDDYTLGELWKSNLLGGRPGIVSGGIR